MKNNNPIVTKNPRKAHPNLYRQVITCGLICVALGLNFLFLKPTFNPLDVPKEIFGVIFLILGASNLFFLNVYKAKILRLTMAITTGFLVFYGLILVVQFFQLKQTSLQLPITYLGLAGYALFSLLEPFSNPATSKENDNGLD